MLFTYASKGSAIKFGRHGDDYVRGIGKACNCFVAGTMIATPDGPKPIEEICVGDEVLSREENKPEAPVRVMRVTTVYRNVTALVVWVALSGGQVFGVTPGHEVWTTDTGWTFVAALEVGDSLVDRAGNPLRVLALETEATPTVTYNFEVEGTYTYFAEGAWVHNNSCPINRMPAGWHRHHLFPDQFRNKFNAMKPPFNIDDDRFLLGLDPEWHSWVHSPSGFDWNGKWRSFWNKHNPSTTSHAEVMEFMEELKAQAGVAFSGIFGQ